MYLFMGICFHYLCIYFKLVSSYLTSYHTGTDGPYALTLIDAMSVWTEWQQDDIMTFDRFLKSLRSISRHAYPQHHPSFGRNAEEDLDVSDISMFLLLYNSMLAVSTSCARLVTRTSSSNDDDDDMSHQQQVVASLWYFYLYVSCSSGNISRI